MKILYVCPDAGIPVLGRKGASMHVRALVAALRRARHSVVVAATCRTKSPWDAAAPLDAELVTPPGDAAGDAAVAGVKELGRALGVAGSLPGELRRIAKNRALEEAVRRRFDVEPPDVVYERASLHSLVGVSLAERFTVPLLVELNAPLAVEQSAYRGVELASLAVAAERRTLTRADAVLAVSSELREHALAVGAEPERVHVVPNGVDTSVFHPAQRDGRLRQRFGLGEGPVLGFVGGLRPWHGVEALPPLVERLAPRHRDLRLVVVGDGTLRSRLEDAFRARGLGEHVRFTGSLPHEEVAVLIRELDAALAPYPRPNGHPFYFSPLKLFEYMASGVPVVAARLGQIAEVVDDGRTGLLYPAGDLDALERACERLLVDPAVRGRIGAAAAREVAGRYTWDGNAERVVALARSLVRSRDGAA